MNLREGDQVSAVALVVESDTATAAVVGDDAPLDPAAAGPIDVVVDGPIEGLAGGLGDGVDDASDDALAKDDGADADAEPPVGDDAE
jgi:hypothetical protein